MAEFKYPATGGSGTGDVVGPASSTDNAVARFNGTGGKTIQNSAVTIDDSGNIATAGTVDGVDISAAFPASSTDEALVRFDGTTGKILQNSVATMNDVGQITAASLSANYFSTLAPTAASAGTVRMENTAVVNWRNNADSGNLSLGTSTGDRLTFNGVVIPTTTSTDALTNKTIDADLNTIINIENADIRSGAAIAYSKLNLATSIVNADINASAAIDGSKIVAASASVPGVVTTGTQTFAGAKTFTSALTVATISASASGVVSNSFVSTSSVSQIQVQSGGSSFGAYTTYKRGSTSYGEIGTDSTKTGLYFCTYNPSFAYVGEVSLAGAWTLPLIHNIGSGNITSGTYNPTPVNTTNVSASTNNGAQYMRVGNVVTVSGTMDITVTTAAGTASVIGLPLPIASVFTNGNQCSGVVSIDSGSGTGFSSGYITSDSGNARARINFNAAASGARTLQYHFTYQIV